MVYWSRWSVPVGSEDLQYYYLPLQSITGTGRFFPKQFTVRALSHLKGSLSCGHMICIWGVNFVSISGCLGLTICLLSVLSSCFLSASRWWRLSFVFPNCLWLSPFPTYFLYCAWIRITHDRSSLSLHFLPGAPLIHAFLFILKKKKNRTGTCLQRVPPSFSWYISGPFWPQQDNSVSWPHGSVPLWCRRFSLSSTACFCFSSFSLAAVSLLANASICSWRAFLGDHCPSQKIMCRSTSPGIVWEKQGSRNFYTYPFLKCFTFVSSSQNAEPRLNFLDTRPLTFLMAAFTATGTVPAVPSVMTTARVPTRCTIESSRIAWTKHGKSKNCTNIFAIIALNTWNLWSLWDLKQLPGVSEIVPTKKCRIISSLLGKRKHENPPHLSNTPNTCARHQTSRIWAVLWINHSQMKAKRNLLQGIIQDHKCSDSPRFQGPPRDPVSSTKSCHCAPLLFHTPPCLDRFSNRFGDWPRGPGETSKNHGIFFRCGNVHQVSPPKKTKCLAPTCLPTRPPEIFPPQTCVLRHCQADDPRRGELQSHPWTGQCRHTMTMALVSQHISTKHTPPEN